MISMLNLYTLYMSGYLDPMYILMFDREAITAMYTLYTLFTVVLPAHTREDV